MLFALLTSSALLGQTPTPQSQQPIFRTGIEILTVDATVVDRDGRQITDLKATEFEVEVDGDPRPVVSAEYVKLVDDTPDADRRQARGGAKAQPRGCVLFDQRAHPDAGPDHRHPRRPGQHPRRPGPPDDAQRGQVRRRSLARGPRRHARDSARRAGRLHHQSRAGAGSAPRDGRPGLAVQGAVPHQPERSDRHRRAQRRDAPQSAVPPRMRRRADVRRRRGTVRDRGRAGSLRDRQSPAGADAGVAARDAGSAEKPGGDRRTEVGDSDLRRPGARRAELRRGRHRRDRR